ncbi:16S rRNA pseudouridine(516) synthase [Sedimentitalea sp. JM2-8]|uniref:Pseudouridine synthase n=1 Tax=Sedimentitalea xiamensis TaxID=3050037 RepID=A0ABT7FKI6_9RHOB|nr:16S rRNA pseudouridine(516) synthase [Sedimentitalea xiamensis]MDK3075655.1 16S rRNA pseudouridine(516) synthase [Sedimentitalea xiamensis]
MSKVSSTRVDRLLSSMGYGTRKDIAHLARSGGIVFDQGEITDATVRIPVSADLPCHLRIGGKALDPLAGMVVLMNKPVGATCSHKEAGALVYDLLPTRWRRRNPAISTIGRLDKQTSGLLLLTDDGNLLHRISSPRSQVRKTYRARLARPLDGAETALFGSGSLTLNGDEKPLAPATLKIISETEALITVTEGRYHQVRRMFAAAGNFVEALRRERLGDLCLPDTLAPGQWSLLSEEEIALVFR